MLVLVIDFPESLDLLWYACKSFWDILILKVFEASIYYRKCIKIINSPDVISVYILLPPPGLFIYRNWKLYVALYIYCILNTWQYRCLGSFETQMSTMFIFCELQIHHRVALSLLAVKEIKPRRLGRGPAHYLSGFPREPLSAGAFLRARKLHAAPQWIKEREKPLASGKWQQRKGKVVAGPCSPSEDRRENLDETVMCLRGLHWNELLAHLSPPHPCLSLLRCCLGLRKPFLWPLESSTRLQPRARLGISFLS